jgi:hypothetical protein
VTGQAGGNERNSEIGSLKRFHEQRFARIVLKGKSETSETLHMLLETVIRKSAGREPRWGLLGVDLFTPAYGRQVGGLLEIGRPWGTLKVSRTQGI